MNGIIKSCALIIAHLQQMRPVTLNDILIKNRSLKKKEVKHVLALFRKLGLIEIVRNERKVIFFLKKKVPSNFPKNFEAAESILTAIEAREKGICEDDLKKQVMENIPGLTIEIFDETIKLLIEAKTLYAYTCPSNGGYVIKTMSPSTVYTGFEPKLQQ